MDKFTGITSNVVANQNYELLNNFIEYLLNLNFNLENKPIEISINDEAFKVFNEYYKRISYQIKTDSLGNGFTGFLSKARNLPAKFALHLLAMGCFLKGINLTDEIYIPAEIMKLGCIISDWFIIHTRYMWEFYLDEFTLDIQPIDEMIFEAIIDLFESGKVTDSAITTKSIKEWIKINKNIEVTKDKIGKILKKLNFQQKRTSKKREWIITENIIISLKSFLSKKLKNVSQMSYVSFSDVTTCNHNIKIDDTFSKEGVTKVSLIQPDIETVTSSMTRVTKVSQRCHSKFNNNINELQEKMTAVTPMTSFSKNKNVKLNNSQSIDDNIKDNPFLSQLDDYIPQPAGSNSQDDNPVKDINQELIQISASNLNENTQGNDFILENQNKLNFEGNNMQNNNKNSIIDYPEDDLNIFDTKPLDDIPDFKPTFKPAPYNELKKFYFDIETTGLDPEKSKLIMIGVMDNKGNIKIFKGKENKILLEFSSFILKEKPDILCGHNIFNFDIPYLEGKYKQHNIKPFFDLINSKKIIGNTSWNGKPIDIKLYRCKNKKINFIDTFILTARYDFSARKLKSYNLKNAVIDLGLRADRRLELSKDEIISLYKQGDYSTIEEYLKYDLEDTKLLADLFIPQYYYQLELLPQHVNLQSLSLMGQATKWNIIISQYYSKKPEPDKKIKFEGALNIANPGLYKNCAKIDVASLYPSIMLNYRICSRKDTKQISLSILKYLTQERLRLKKLAKSGDKEADYKQQAMKILINSLYGFLGTSGVEFNDMQAGALVTAYGRAILKFMIDEIINAGGIIAEADTDGIIYSANDIYKIYEIVKSKLPQGINIELEIKAKAVLVFGKKNYIVLTDDNRLIIKGKLASRDRTKLEKEFYPNFLKNYLQSPEKAEKYYHKIKEKIRTRTIDLELLTYERVIRKGEKKIVEAGVGKVGERVKYYIGEGNKPVKNGDYSISYYLNEIDKMKQEIMDLIKNKDVKPREKATIF